MRSFQDITSIEIVDTHVHVFPDGISKAIRRWFSQNAWEFFEQGTTEELVASLFSKGLYGAVFLSYAHKPGLSRTLNEYTSALARRFPRSVGLATVHPADSDPRGILREAFEGLGLRGVKLHCHVQRVAPDAPELDPVYEMAMDWGLPVTIHGGKEPYVEAYGIDVREITGAMRIERILRRFPDLKLIVPHLGFGETERFFELLDVYPNLYLDTTMVLAGFFPVKVNTGLLRSWASRILYGTDYPHIPYEVERELLNLLNLGLGEGELRMILHENAKKLFGIP